MLTIRSITNVRSICCAESMKEAREIFGASSKGEEVTQLTYGRLSGLTGCIIPSYVTLNEFAKGNLMFRSADRIVSLWL